MVRTLSGIVHGRMIELDEEPGMADGQQVEVSIRATPVSANRGEGIRMTAGALASDLDWDGIMEEMHQARKLARHSSTDLK